MLGKSQPKNHLCKLVWMEIPYPCHMYMSEHFRFLYRCQVLKHLDKMENHYSFPLKYNWGKSLPMSWMCK